MPRPGEFGNGCRQDADGAGASNQHILRQEVEGQGGMGGIAEGIKDGVQLLRNLGGAGNDVGGGNYQVLCEGAVPVDADARGVFTQVPPAGAAVTAHAADDVPLAGDQLAQVMSLYGGAHFHDFADILMPGSGAHPEGILRPLIPVPDVYICATNGGLVNFDHDIVVAYGGNLYALHGEALCRLVFDQCPHGSSVQFDHSSCHV